jgi:hypothetical protein
VISEFYKNETAIKHRTKQEDNDIASTVLDERDLKSNCTKDHSSKNPFLQIYHKECTAVKPATNRPTR